MRTAIITALARNPVGQLVEDLMLQGGVDTSLVCWVPYEGIGRTVRNGLNFTERGFGLWSAVVTNAAIQAARSSGTRVSYDLNYRESFWKGIGGKAKAQDANRELVSALLGQISILHSIAIDAAMSTSIVTHSIPGNWMD